MTSIPLGMEVADTRLKLVRPIARPISGRPRYAGSSTALRGAEPVRRRTGMVEGGGFHSSWNGSAQRQLEVALRKTPPRLTLREMPRPVSSINTAI